MMIETSTTVRINSAANEIWPAVRGEIRGNGKVVFPNLDALTSNLTRAFHKGLVIGEQHKENSVIWVNRDSALDYTAGYVELAKASLNAKIHLPWRRKNARPKGQVDISKYAQPGTPVRQQEEEAGSHYSVVMGGEIIPLLRDGRPVKCPTVQCAALKALKQLQVGLYREINGKLVRVV